MGEYINKGFTLDDERLKEAGGGNYFDELLARIRDIRSSEKLLFGTGPSKISGGSDGRGFVTNARTGSVAFTALTWDGTANER